MDPFPRWPVYVAGKLTLAVSRRPPSLCMWPLHGMLGNPYHKADVFPKQGKAIPYLTLKSPMSFLLDSSRCTTQHDSEWEEIRNDRNTGR